MTVWLAIIAVVGGIVGVFVGLRTLADTLWPLPDQPRRRHLRVVDKRHERVIEP